MVFTLHKYVFRELMRVFILSTVALTFVLSLGSLLRPIQEYGVSPNQAMQLLGYFLPITLTVVLPISALFAAALIYGRFASDNELNACKASGISLMTMVYPGLCLAIAVSITTLILSFYVVPAFVHRAERSVQGNVKQIVFRNIQRKGYYEMPGGRFRIYADEAVPQTDTLHGVIIVESKKGEISKHIFAERAKILIESTKNANIVTAVAENVHELDPDGGQKNMASLPVKHPFPPLLSDNIKFQKIDQLKEIQANMANFEPVRKLLLEARAQLFTEMLAEEIQAKLSRPNNNYYQMASNNKIISYSAASAVAENDATVTLMPPIDLLEYEPMTRKLEYRWSSKEPASIKLKNNEPGAKMDMVIKNASWSRSFIPTPQKIVYGILPPPELAAKLGKMSLVESVNTIGEDGSPLNGKPSAKLISLKHRVDAEIWKTTKRISAEVHTRLVFGIGCITLVLFAIALGVVFRGGHLLSAFGTSSIPAGILIIFIMSGKELIKTKNTSVPESTGIILMWSGLIMLSAACFMIYRKITRT